VDKEMKEAREAVRKRKKAREAAYVLCLQERYFLASICPKNIASWNCWGRRKRNPAVLSRKKKENFCN
jgi:hypothetical protein